jgi:uncharacterized membrane protein YgcG
MKKAIKSFHSTPINSLVMTSDLPPCVLKIKTIVGTSLTCTICFLCVGFYLIAIASTATLKAESPVLTEKANNTISTSIDTNLLNPQNKDGSNEYCCDYYGLLSRETTSRLETLLKTIHQDTSQQIILCIISSVDFGTGDASVPLNTQTPKVLSRQFFSEWNIGKDNKNSQAAPSAERGSILFYIPDRGLLFFENGKGFTLPQSQEDTILGKITPALSQQRFDEAFLSLIGELKAALANLPVNDIVPQPGVLGSSNVSTALEKANSTLSVAAPAEKEQEAPKILGHAIRGSVFMFMLLFLIISLPAAAVFYLIANRNKAKESHLQSAVMNDLEDRLSVANEKNPRYKV